MLQSTMNISDSATYALKDMDTALLTVAVLSEAQVSAEDRMRLSNAIVMASHLHHSDTRMTPVLASDGTRRKEVSPYIEHPLRNTLRLIRWGVRDADMLIAEVLHDVVEDHADDISGILQDKVASREYALAVIAERFGNTAALLVRKMSNPFTSAGSSREERNRVYADHVRDVITDVRVFLLKWSDFNDNALSLDKGDVTDVRTTNRARKYLPIVDIFENSYRDHQENRRLVTILSFSGQSAIGKKVSKAKLYLENIILLGTQK